MILKSSSCDHSDAYVLVKGAITVLNMAVADAAAAVNNANKKVIFKNCVSFNGCISEINNTQLYNAKHFDRVTTMYNLIEYSDNCLRTSGLVWKYCRN